MKKKRSKKISNINNYLLITLGIFLFIVTFIIFFTGFYYVDSKIINQDIYQDIFGATGSVVSGSTSSSGIWISKEEIMALPMSGAAWTNVKSEADQSACTPALSNQGDNCNVRVLAKALVYARTGDTKYLNDVKNALTSIANSGTYNGRALALGRELAAYVISADIIDLKNNDSTLDSKFRNKIKELLTTPTTEGGPSNLIDCHEKRPNNWGTDCGASRIAVDLYLGETTDLERAVEVFKGWVGDRASYAGFDYGDLSWQCDSTKPVGINPQGCFKDGHSIDGVLPDDQRRGGSFTWPPPKENYVWGALQGASVQAELLNRAGYDSWNWENKALLRAVQWVHNEANFSAVGDDTWIPWLVNHAYGTSFPAQTPASSGKNMGWTDWTHATKDSSVSKCGNNFCEVGESCSSCSKDCGTCPLSCADNDNDGYGNPASNKCSYPQLDCNDNNNKINPGVNEVCTNNIDDNCDGKIDSSDSDCVTSPICGNNQCETGESCSSCSQDCGACGVSRPVKVAFIGDQGLGSKAEGVLQLIKNEGADMVIHSGDLDYKNDPVAWDNQINKILGENFPYFVSIGNHDTSKWSGTNGYQDKFKQRLDRISGEDCNGDLGIKSSCSYKGLFFVLSGVGTSGSGHELYIKSELSNSNTPWEICSWHKNQKEMQVGGKSSAVGWEAYETCREQGALIITAHEHSYHRTKTLTNIQTLTVDTKQHPLVNGVPGNPDSVAVAPGKTFVVVSGMGGNSLRDQERCSPISYPYGGGDGCNYIWANIYTLNQSKTAIFGALFITFNVNGDTNKAEGYFKNTNGEIIDQFDIIRDAGGGGSFCGDGSCNSGESCSSCSQDCGSCSAQCGNNVKEGIEECDESDVGGFTCQDLGYDEGNLACSNCKLDTSQCTKTSCGLTNARWSKTSAVDGEKITLILEGNNCAFKDRIEYKIYEDDGILGSDLVTSFTKGYNQADWISKYLSDQLGNPEFYFTAQFIGSDKIINSKTLGNPLLEVSQSEAVCGNNICETGESCSSCNSDCDVCPPIQFGKGIWISKEEIMKLPMSGEPWNKVLTAAKSDWGSACLNDNNCVHDVKTLAGALVAVRMNDSEMRAKVIKGLEDAMNSETSRTLELARGLQTYVIAADIIGYNEPSFKSWLKNIIDDSSISGREGGGLYYNALRDSSNWGGHERASVAAALIYLDDPRINELVRSYKEYIGIDVSPKTLNYKSTNWHADSINKAGVNRKGFKINGVSVSGVLPEDWRRGGEFKWFPSTSGYMWEGMQGYIVTAVILHRAGYVPINSGDNAVVRSMDMLYGMGEASSNNPVFKNPPSGDDTWIPWVVNYYAGTSYSTSTANYGKNMGWTDWTYTSKDSSGSKCGNNFCEIGESCSSCSQDCGVCAPALVCGNNRCETGESCSSCSKDCGSCSSVCNDFDEDDYVDYDPVSCKEGKDKCIEPISSVNFSKHKPEIKDGEIKIGKGNVHNASEVIIKKINKGEIQFLKEISLLTINGTGCYKAIDIDSFVIIENKRVFVNTSLFSKFNKPAVIKFYNITFIDPVILRDNSECSECRILSYINGTLDVEVPGFSEYEVIEGDDINDVGNQTDGSYPGSRGGSSGGGSSRKVSNDSCIEIWKCGEWTECINRVKTRTCIDLNRCNSFHYKPVDLLECEGFEEELQEELDEEIEEDIQEDSLFLERLFPPRANKQFIGVVVLLVLAILVIISYLITRALRKRY